MEQSELTVILPCAGEGSRLGLSGPKELYEVEVGRPLIRYSLDLLLKTQRKTESQITVAVVIRKGKESVVDYVRKYLSEDRFKVVSVHFDPHLREWPGSIYSAKHVFSEKNILLLPDSFVHYSASDLLSQMVDRLDLKLLVFGAKPTDDTSEICRLGALQLNGKLSDVVCFEDKPDTAADHNAIWGCFGFHQKIADELHDFLMASVEHQNNQYRDRSFFPAGSLAIENYFDLGTWERIETFREWKRVNSIQGD